MTPDVLVVCDFSGNTDKIHRHIGPLTRIANPTVVCITPDHSVENVNYRTVPSFGFRPIGLAGMFLLALFEGIRRDYDAVASFSLVPHGCFALLVAWIVGLPVHLGIIGADLDVHAKARYARPIIFLLRQFDVISVPGSVHARQLQRHGIDSRRVAILTNAIDVEVYTPPRHDVGTRYDFLWIGRFEVEKDPLLFVRALAELAGSDPAIDAAMLGDGPLHDAVRSEIHDYGLEGIIELPGWVDDPLKYYHHSRIFVLTSRRDALPLTLIEAMATGLACVVPNVGNVRDVAVDGSNAMVLDNMTPTSLAETFQWLRKHPDLVDRLGSQATHTASSFSYESAAEDWQGILQTMSAN